MKGMFLSLLLVVKVVIVLIVGVRLVVYCLGFCCVMVRRLVLMSSGSVM